MQIKHNEIKNLYSIDKAKQSFLMCKIYFEMKKK